MEQSRSKRSWLNSCCARPEAKDDLAPLEHLSSDSAAAQKPTILSNNVVAATAHCDSAAAPTAQAGPTLDLAPSADQIADSSATITKVKMGSVTDSAKKGRAVAAPQAAAAHFDMNELKHMMASSMNRPYTDADWFAAMRVLEQVLQQQRQHALQQLPMGSKPLQRGSFTSMATADEVWHDAISHTMSDTSAVSEAERQEVAQLAAELELLRGPVSVVRELSCTPTCVPNPPLLFAEPHWKYCQVDARPFCSYWERDSVRSTPFPLPIDLQLKMNSFLRRCHESIPGMWLRMEGNQLLLTASPDIIAIPGVVNYTEYFNTDSTLSHWALRRDIGIGKTQGQMFMTTDGILIFRVFTYGMFSKTIEWIGEDYMRVEDNGQTIITRQLCKAMKDNTVESQFLIGRNTGPVPPPRHGRHSHA